MNNDLVKAFVNEFDIPSGLWENVIRPIQTYETRNGEMSYGQQREAVRGFASLLNPPFRWAYKIAEGLLDADGYAASMKEVILGKVFENRGYLASATPGFVKRYVDAAAGIPVENSCIPAGEVFASLKYHLNRENGRKLRLLIDKADPNLTLRVSWDDLIERVPKIRERLQKISDDDVKQLDGEKLGEKMAAIEVMKVIYGKTRSDPLHFFLDHYGVFCGMSRVELQRAYHGLYSRLYQSGRIGEAIPEFRGEEEGKYALEKSTKVYRILEALRLNSGNVRRTAKDLGYTQKTVGYWAANAGIKRSDRRHLINSEIDTIVTSIRENGFNETVRRLPFGRGTVYRIAKEHGLTRGIKRMVATADGI